MLISLCDLHEITVFHGRLHNLENYTIKFVPSYEGKKEQSHADVIFKYRNMESVIGKPKIVKGHQNDIWAVSIIIFGKILGGLLRVP